jgi:hypothetical protein
MPRLRYADKKEFWENPVYQKCINLKQRYGDLYRVTYEESYRGQYGPHARVEDPWLMIIPCKYGHLYPFGGTTLAASVDGHPNVAGMLRRLPCCRVHQDGDFGELTVVFDVVDFPKVAEIMKPRRRRVLSDEARQALVQANQATRFQPRRHGVQSDLEARPCVPEPQVDPKPPHGKNPCSSLWRTPERKRAPC